jgi:hypothetical protein
MWNGVAGLKGGGSFGVTIRRDEPISLVVCGIGGVKAPLPLQCPPVMQFNCFAHAFGSRHAGQTFPPRAGVAGRGKDLQPWD